MFYARDKGALKVIALKASNGKLAWAAPASPSDVTPGSPLELVTRDGIVYYLEGLASDGDGVASIVARNAATGQVMWASESGVFGSWPEICPDQPSALCVSGLTASASGELRFSATTGKLIAKLSMATPGGNEPREVGRDLFDPGSRHPEQLVAVTHGRVAWRHSLSTIFTLPDASTDGGWDLDRNAKLGLFVGSVGIEPNIKNGHYTIDLSKAMTAGFSLANGHTAWRTPGTYVCGVFPCVGSNEAGYSSPSSLSSVAIGTRLIETGTLSGTVGGSSTYSPDATVTFQGFKPATGKTIWSFRAGHNTTSLATGALPQNGPNSIVLKTGSSETALDLGTGATRRLRSNAQAWCQRLITYTLKDTGYYHGKSGSYTGQIALYPCTVGGSASKIPASIPSFISKQGANADGLTAWTGTNAIYAEPS